ncbi:MAG TPA: CYTH domain-containing protein [Streptosporangiaceae bacterium]|jgi:inorganic triphosphatase YgiF|nr:CYTH domain-containing protein [Streptosporangiaceae bacterium]
MNSSGHSQTEIEQKYDATPDFVLPDLAGSGAATAMSPPQTVDLSAIYFDTSDFRLANAKVTLRRREGGSDAGWHVKLPVSADTRREVHFPLGPATTTVPQQVADVVAEWTRGESLVPIARLQTTRTSSKLIDAAGRVLAEVADDLVTGSRPAQEGTQPGEAGAAPRWEVRSRWREIEVELVSGRRDLLQAAGERLRAAGARPSGSASKLARLLAAG